RLSANIFTCAKSGGTRSQIRRLRPVMGATREESELVGSRRAQHRDTPELSALGRYLACSNTRGCSARALLAFGKTSDCATPNSGCEDCPSCAAKSIVASHL